MRMVLYGDTQLMNASSVDFLFHKVDSMHCVGADLLTAEEIRCVFDDI